MSKVKCQKSNNGFTIIEALVFLFIFVVAVTAVYAAFNAGLNQIIENKRKLAAIALANEEIEKLRNLGYNNLPGSSTDIEITKNGVKFWESISVREVVDEMDGLSPGDVAPMDYRKVKITVKWDLNNDRKKIYATGIIVPPVREEQADLGYLKLLVINQNGDGLSHATVRIDNADTGANIFPPDTVDDGGNLFLPGLSPGNYKITVMDNSEIYKVWTRDVAGLFQPTAEMSHAVISLEGNRITEKTIVTDKTSTLDLSLETPLGVVINHLGFSFFGGKYIGITNGNPTYSDATVNVSDSDGTESYSGLSYGPYFFDITDLNDGLINYEFLWMEPVSDSIEKINLDADTTLSTKAILAPTTDMPSLLVTVTDNANSPILGAKVTVQQGVNTYIQSTNVFGKVYFPENSGELTNGSCNISVTAVGYESETGINENINDYTKKTISLDPS